MTVFSGKLLFELKATHGLPLDITLHEVLVRRSLRVDWVEFIQTGRNNGWWDYQIIEAIEVGLADAGVPPDDVSAIVTRAKLWMQKEPLIGGTRYLRLPSEKHLEGPFYTLPDSVNTDEEFVAWIDTIVRD